MSGWSAFSNLSLLWVYFLFIAYLGRGYRLFARLGSVFLPFMGVLVYSVVGNALFLSLD